MLWLDAAGRFGNACNFRSRFERRNGKQSIELFDVDHAAFTDFTDAEGYVVFEFCLEVSDYFPVTGRHIKIGFLGQFGADLLVPFGEVGHVTFFVYLNGGACNLLIHNVLRFKPGFGWI